MNVIAALSSAVVFAFGVLTTAATADVRMSVDPGPVNGVLLEANGHRLAVYGWKPDDAAAVDYVLLAHGRRDIVWKAKPLIDAGTKVIAPNRERFGLEKPGDFWKEFTTGRFHDYAQQASDLGHRQRIHARLRLSASDRRCEAIDCTGRDQKSRRHFRDALS